jgi:hypothetical protein
MSTNVCKLLKLFAEQDLQKIKKAFLCGRTGAKEGALISE